MGLLLVSQCFAETDRKGLSIGGLIGTGSYNNRIGNQLSFGGLAHYKFNPHVGVGVTLTYAKLFDRSFSGVATVQMNSIHIDGDFKYHFTGTLGGFWMGTRLGLWSFSTSVSASSDITSTGATFSPSDNALGFEWGPALGYDYSLSRHLLLGLDFSFLTVHLNNISLNVSQALGTVKYHF